MAKNTRREIELALSITTQNADALAKLQKDVRDLSKEGGDAAPAFQKLADELGQLAEQAKQLSALEGLTKDIEAAAAAQSAAAKQSNGLKLSLQELAQAADVARNAERQKAAELRASRAAAQEARDAIAELKEETSAAEKNSVAYVTRLMELKKNLREANKEKRAFNLQLVELKEKTAEAVAAIGKQNAQFQAAERVTKSAGRSMLELQNQAREVGEKLRAAGGGAESLAEANKQLALSAARVKTSIASLIADQDRLAQAERDAANEALRQAAIIEATKRQQAAQAKAEADGIIADYERMQQAQRQAAQSARAAGEAIAGAFGTVGQRSVVEIRAEIERVRAAMQLLSTSGAATGAELAQAMRSGNNAIKELQREIREVTGSLTMADKAANLFKNSIGQISAGNLIADAIGSLVETVNGMAREFVTANLEMDRLTRTMTQITGSSTAAAQQIAFLRDAANTAGVSISSVTDSFIRFQASASASGMAASEVNEMFKAVTVAGSRMGMSNDRIALSLDALSQIASKGTVSLEELRQQLGDSLPGAMAIAAKGLGITTAELIKLVESGNLASKDFFPAFRKGLEESFGSSDNAVQGLVQSFQRLHNQFIMLYQQAADSTAFRVLASSMDAITRNFDTLVTVTGTLTQAWITLKAVDLARGLFFLGDASRKATIDITAQTAATTGNTQATGANTAATNVNTEAKRLNALANTQSAQAASNNAQAWQSLGTALGNTSSKAGAASGSMTTVAAEAGKAGAAARIAAAGKDVLSTAMVGATNAARGLVGLLGGPLGLIALFVSFRNEIGELAGRFVMWATGQKTLEQSTKELAEAQKREEEQAKAVTAERERQTEADKRAAAAKYGLNAEAFKLINTFDGLIKEGKKADEAIGQIGKDFDLSNIPGIRAASGVLDKLAADGKISAAQFEEAWAGALKGVDLVTFEVNFKAMLLGLETEAKKAGEEVEKAIAKGASQKTIDDLKQKAELAATAVKDAGERTAKVFDVTLKEAIRRTGLDMGLISSGMGKASASAINDVDVIIRGLDGLKSQGVDTSRVLTASLSKAIDTADGQKSLDTLRGKIEQVRGALGDKVADGLLDQAKKKAEELKDALDEATPGINSAREAFKALGVETDAALKDKAKTAREAYDAIKNSGTASAREINEAWKVMAEASIKANDGVADSTIKSEAAARGFAIETNAAGKSVVKSLSEAKGAAKGVGDEMGATGEKGKDALGKIDYAAKMAGKSLEELEKITRANWDANRDLSDQAAESNAAANEAVGAWQKQQQEQNKYFGEMAKILQKTRMGYAELKKAAWAGANALEALDKQQKAIEQSSGGAAKELQDMKDKLAELDGSEEVVAQNRTKRDKAEVERKMALMQLDLQRAQIRKDDDEVARLSAELAAYQEQLRLIDQIAAKESQARQRKAKEEKAAQRERDRAQEESANRERAGNAATQRERMDGIAEEGAARDAEAERLAQEAQKKLEEEMRKRQAAEDEALRKKRAAEDKAAQERYDKERKALEDAEKQRQDALRRESEARAEARAKEDERIRIAEAARVAREKADRDAAAKAAQAQEAQRAEREAKAKTGTRSTEEEAALARQRDAVLAAQKEQAEEQARLEAERAEAAAQARAKRLQEERSAEDKAAAERERVASEAHQRRLQELEEAERRRKERVDEERAREDERIAAQRERDAALLKAMQDVATSVLAIAQAAGAQVPLGGAAPGVPGVPGAGGRANDAVQTVGGGGGGAGVSRGPTYVSKINLPGIGETTAMFENQRDQRAMQRMLSVLSTASRAAQ